MQWLGLQNILSFLKWFYILKHGHARFAKSPTEIEKYYFRTAIVVSNWILQLSLVCRKCFQNISFSRILQLTQPNQNRWKIGYKFNWSAVNTRTLTYTPCAKTSGIAPFKGVEVDLFLRFAFTCQQSTAGGVLPYSLGGSVLLGSRKSHPLLDQTVQELQCVTLYQTKRVQLFLISIFCERSR